MYGVVYDILRTGDKFRRCCGKNRYDITYIALVCCRRLKPRYGAHVYMKNVIEGQENLSKRTESPIEKYDENQHPIINTDFKHEFYSDLKSYQYFEPSFRFNDFLAFGT